MDQAFKNKVLIVSAADAVRQMVSSYVREDQIVQFKSLDEVDAKLEALGDGLLFCVICDATTLEKEVIEIGQLIHNQCPKTPSFIVTTRREGFNPKGYIKNGFSEAFLLPLDEPDMKQKVSDTISAEALAARSLRSVMADDIHASTELDFDTFVFLPLNKKYVRYFSSKGSVSEDRLGRLKKGNHRRLYVDQKDIGRFYNYTAEQLLKIGKTDNSMSETEKVEKLQTSVRHLFTDLFEDVGETASISEGKDRWINCQKIVSSYITNGEGDWYSRLLKAAGGISGGYSKATGVSSIAALLGIGLGLKTVEDLAIAGMLCDLGLPEIPAQFEGQPLSKWPEELCKAYMQHPLKSVNLCKTKKMILTHEVEVAILQHHERFDGKGFPDAKPGFKISEEAQILSIADQLYDLTVERMGQQSVTLEEAFASIAANGSINPEIAAKVRKILVPKGETKAKVGA